MLFRIKLLRKSLSILSWSNLAFGVGSTIILLPLLVTRLSAAELAVYYLFQMLFSLGGLVDFGFGETVARATTYFLSGRKDIPKEARGFIGATEGDISGPNIDGLLRLRATSSQLYTVLGLIAVLFGGSLGVWLFWTAITLAGEGWDLWLGFGVTLLAVFFGFKIASYSSMAYGLQLVRESIEIGLRWNIVRLILAMGGLLAGWGVAGMAFSMLVGNLGTYWSQRRQVMRWSNGALCQTCKFDPSLLRGLWPATWRAGGTGVGAYLINYSSGLIIAQIPDAALVASFLMTSRMLMIVRRFSDIPLDVKIPLLIAYRAQGNRAMFLMVAFQRIAMVLILFCIGVVALDLFGPWLLSAINTKASMASGVLYWIMALSLLLEVHHSMHIKIYVTTNHVPFLWPTILSGIAIVLLGAISIAKYGIYGPVCAQALVQICFNNWFPVWLNFRDLEISPSHLMRRMKKLYVEKKNAYNIKSN